MLSELAAIALIVGGVSVTAELTENERLAAEEIREPVVEVQVQALESVDGELEKN